MMHETFVSAQIQDMCLLKGLASMASVMHAFRHERGSNQLHGLSEATAVSRRTGTGDIKAASFPLTPIIP